MGAKTEWDILVEALKTKHAQRMNDLLDELPDKQFRIVYPKLLEFCIPKMQRREVLKENNIQNNILQIQVVNSPEEIDRYKESSRLEVEDEEFDPFEVVETPPKELPKDEKED